MQLFLFGPYLSLGPLCACLCCCPEVDGCLPLAGIERRIANFSHLPVHYVSGHQPLHQDRTGQLAGQLRCIHNPSRASALRLLSAPTAACVRVRMRAQGEGLQVLRYKKTQEYRVSEALACSSRMVLGKACMRARLGGVCACGARKSGYTHEGQTGEIHEGLYHTRTLRCLPACLQAHW